ncbi:hypothetical protein GCM10019017_04920 [Streptomyces showdoensis]
MRATVSARPHTRQPGQSASAFHLPLMDRRSGRAAAARAPAARVGTSAVTLKEGSPAKAHANRASYQRRPTPGPD